MLTAQFSATALLGGKTATVIRVPGQVVDILGAGRRPAVRVTVGGHTYRSNVAVMGGDFMVPLSAENRSRAGVTAGDDVEVRLELDTERRDVTVPADLAAALEPTRRPGRASKRSLTAGSGGTSSASRAPGRPPRDSGAPPRPWSNPPGRRPA